VKAGDINAGPPVQYGDDCVIRRDFTEDSKGSRQEVDGRSSLSSTVIGVEAKDHTQQRIIDSRGLSMDQTATELTIAPTHS
jgi:hypothetical protein